MRLLVALLLVVACRGARPEPPGSRLAAVEAALLGPEPRELAFRVRAEGAVEVEASGTMLFGTGGRSRFEVTGSFQGQPVEVLRVCDGDVCGGRRAGAVMPVRPQERGLRRAWVLGLTRMGILHNVAVATAGDPPDHPGDIDAWVQAENETHADGRLAFDVVVDGERSARAELTLDAGGAPSRREQSVAFPTGEMRVVETYAWRSQSAPDEARFAVPDAPPGDDP